MQVTFYNKQQHFYILLCVWVENNKNGKGNQQREWIEWQQLQCLAAEFLDKMLLGFFYTHTWKEEEVEEIERERKKETDTNHLHLLQSYEISSSSSTWSTLCKERRREKKKKHPNAYKSDWIKGDLKTRE